MANIVPESWRDRAFRAGEQEVGRSVAEVLPAHDTETIKTSKAQHRLGKLVNRVRCSRGMSLRWTSSPRRCVSEARAIFKERRRREVWPKPGNGVNRDQGLPPS